MHLFPRPAVRRALIAVGALAIGACTAGTILAPTLYLIFSGPLVVQGHDTTGSADSSYVCHFPITLTTTGGRSGELATFDSAGYQVQLENGSATYSGQLAHGNLFYPKTEITAGDTLVQNFAVVAAGPFYFSTILYYSAPQGDTGSTAYTSTCE
jgi:hypothetical protein